MKFEPRPLVEPFPFHQKRGMANKFNPMHLYLYLSSILVLVFVVILIFVSAFVLIFVFVFASVFVLSGSGYVLDQLVVSL